MIYSAGGDLFNQCPNANKMAASWMASSSSWRRTTS